jgi:uncharacterized protein YkwD
VYRRWKYFLAGAFLLISALGLCGGCRTATQTASYLPETQGVTEDIQPSLQIETADTPSEEQIRLTNEEGKELALENLHKYAEMSEEIIACINTYRHENGLAQLEQDDTLTLLAMQRTAENAYMDWMEIILDDEGMHHLRPDGSRVSTIFSFYELYGTYGEILGRRQLSVSEVIEDWKASPEHNACMLSSSYERIGAGVAQNEAGEYYFAAEFFTEKK